jgi:septum formation protein
MIYLASKSPRRHELLAGMDIKFEYLPVEVDEFHPAGFSPIQIAEFLSQHKLSTIQWEKFTENDIFIACDTIVVLVDIILEKPENEADAMQMLRLLSGKEHEVISGLTVATKKKQLTNHRITKVKFKEFSDEEIHYYVTNYRPFDKAGAYGIQEWIGYVGVEYIEGSFFNVMGLPTKLLYEMLTSFDTDAR